MGSEMCIRDRRSPRERGRMGTSARNARLILLILLELRNRLLRGVRRAARHRDVALHFLVVLLHLSQRRLESVELELVLVGHSPRVVAVGDARFEPLLEFSQVALRVVPSFKATNVGVELKGVRSGVERRASRRVRRD